MYTHTLTSEESEDVYKPWALEKGESSIAIERHKCPDSDIYAILHIKDSMDFDYNGQPYAKYGWVLWDYEYSHRIVFCPYCGERLPTK